MLRLGHMVLLTVPIFSLVHSSGPCISSAVLSCHPVCKNCALRKGKSTVQGYSIDKIPFCFLLLIFFSRPFLVTFIQYHIPHTTQQPFFLSFPFLCLIPYPLTRALSSESPFSSHLIRTMDRLVLFSFVLLFAVCVLCIVVYVRLVWLCLILIFIFHFYSSY